MEREIIFNYNALNNYLNEQQKNPDWTDWELTMFRDNCKNHLKKDQDMSKLTISINDDTLDITINWQKGLENIFYMLPTWYEMSKKARLYRQVLSALEEAKYRGIYDLIFKTKKDLESLKESVENPN